MQVPIFKPIADHALLVQLGDEISDALSQQVQQLDRAIAQAAPKGLRETIPAFVNLLVDFDPLVTDHEDMATAISALIGKGEVATGNSTLHEVLVCYEADLAPDLEAVAQATGLSREAVIATHLASTFKVGMYGFAPGYAYLSGVPEVLQLPRKPAAVRDIAAGSVLIAGPQCLVTTLTMPTGWSIIGRSPTEILRNDPDRPFLFDVGDEVSFKRITHAEFEKLSKGRTR